VSFNIIGVMDFKRLKQVCGDYQFGLEIVELFFGDEKKAQVETISLAIQSDDHPKLYHCAHWIVEDAGILGFTQLQVLARALKYEIAAPLVKNHDFEKWCVYQRVILIVVPKDLQGIIWDYYVGKIPETPSPTDRIGVSKCYELLDKRNVLYNDIIKEYQIIEEELPKLKEIAQAEKDEGIEEEIDSEEEMVEGAEEATQV